MAETFPKLRRSSLTVLKACQTNVGNLKKKKWVRVYTVGGNADPACLGTGDSASSTMPGFDEEELTVS